MPTSLALRITDLRKAGTISAQEAKSLLSQEAAMWRGMNNLADQLNVSVIDLLGRYANYVMCRAQKHRYDDSPIFLDNIADDGGYVVYQVCDRCAAKSYHYHDSNFVPQFSLGYVWPPGYDFDKRAAGLTPKDWRPAAAYIRFASHIYKRENRGLSLVRGLA